MKTTKLFSPFKLGNITLAHRVVLAPLTRQRASDEHVHGDLALEYYSQRASTPGTLLITEATFIAAEAGGMPNVPGIWSDPQIAAWKKITDAVHERKSFIFLQLWALGRAASPKVLDKEGPFPFVSSSDIPIVPGKQSPRPLTIQEIKKYISLYAKAASNAVHKAGFDGVEIHAANGYLIDQFTQDTCNKRTDEYGGSIENRSRFALEVVKAVTEAVGAKRTGIRMSPWSLFQAMRMKDPIPTFTYLVNQLASSYPELAYIHAVEPVIAGDQDYSQAAIQDSNEFIRNIWQPRPMIVAGGYTPKTITEVVEKDNVVVAMGRLFLANPDLPIRIQRGLPLNPYDRTTFYKRKSPQGYIDYPFAVTPKL